METRAKVFGATLLLSGLAWWLWPVKPKLKYRAIEGSADGMTGKVEWELQLPGKTYKGVRDASGLLPQGLTEGDYTFSITNKAAEQGFPVNFLLTDKANNTLIAVGMLPVLEFMAHGWETVVGEKVAIGASGINKDHAKQIAGEWHGGQNSGLYQFASSGITLPERHWDYVREIQDNLDISGLKPTQKKQLLSLLRYFEKEYRK